MALRRLQRRRCRSRCEGPGWHVWSGCGPARGCHGDAQIQSTGSAGLLETLPVCTGGHFSRRSLGASHAVAANSGCGSGWGGAVAQLLWHVVASAYVHPQAKTQVAESSPPSGFGGTAKSPAQERGRLCWLVRLVLLRSLGQSLGLWREAHCTAVFVNVAGGRVPRPSSWRGPAMAGDAHAGGPGHVSQSQDPAQVGAQVQ